MAEKAKAKSSDENRLDNIEALLNELTKTNKELEKENKTLRTRVSGSEEKSKAQKEADEYMDEKAYNQALSTWQNNFNQYITLAQQYNEKYEYLDTADRQAYETKLNSYLNMLGVAQDQYQHDTSLAADAANNYATQATNVANYNESVRSNKANEKLQKAELKETKRKNNLDAAASAAALAETKRKNNLDAKAAAAASKPFEGDDTTSDFIYSHSTIVNRHVDLGNVSDDITSEYKKGKISKKEADYLKKYYRNYGWQSLNKRSGETDEDLKSRLESLLKKNKDWF